MNLHDLFAIPVHRTPNKPALRYAAEDGAASDFTYAALFAEADRLAAGFRARGVKKGDRIAFFVSNRPEFVTAYHANAWSGRVAILIISGSPPPPLGSQAYYWAWRRQESGSRPSTL